MATRIHMVGPISSEAVYQLALQAIDSGLTIPQQAAVILERELQRSAKRRRKLPGLVATPAGKTGELVPGT
jgi:hypothetical protein